MPRLTKGPHPGGSAQHRHHLLASLAMQLIVRESIRATETRVHRLRPYVERLITKGKRGGLHACRIAPKRVMDEYAVYHPFEELASKFKGHEGGYTHIIKTTPHKGDNTPIAIISLVLEPVARKGIVEGAVATAKKTVQKAAADEDKAEKKVMTGKAEEADKVDKADKVRRVGAVRLEKGVTDAPDDDHLVKDDEDSMKHRVPGLRRYDATVIEVWFASAKDTEVAGFAPVGGAVAQKVGE